MITFNFKDKRISCVSLENAMLGITHVVSPYVRLEAEPEECTVIEMFKDKLLHVAYPASALGEKDVHFLDFDNSAGYWAGKIKIPQSPSVRVASILNGTLYIGSARD